LAKFNSLSWKKVLTYIVSNNFFRNIMKNVSHFTYQNLTSELLVQMRLRPALFVLVFVTCGACSFSTCCCWMFCLSPCCLRACVLLYLLWAVVDMRFALVSLPF
jgi:hypothetical protein